YVVGTLVMVAAACLRAAKFMAAWFMLVLRKGLPPPPLFIMFPWAFAGAPVHAQTARPASAAATSRFWRIAIGCTSLCSNGVTVELSAGASRPRTDHPSRR